MAGHWGIESLIEQYGRGWFLKEEVYAEARTEMLSALSNWDVKGTGSYLKKQERTSTCLGLSPGKKMGRGCSYLRELISRTRLSQEMFSSLPRCSVPRTSFWNTKSKQEEVHGPASLQNALSHLVLTLYQPLPGRNTNLWPADPDKE